jgi:hypothetical protein
VLEAAAQALADLRQPDLTAYPDRDVRTTIDTLMATGLEPLRARILEKSGGQVRLEDEPNLDKFMYQSKEWGARYQRLRREQLVVVGRSTPPFLFVPHRR